MSLIRSVRAALAYTSAGKWFDRGDYQLAKLKIENAAQLLGPKLEKPGTFEVHLRAALIYAHLNDAKLAVSSLERAANAIERYKGLSEIDRGYLLDYCDALSGNVTRAETPYCPRLRDEQHAAVHQRYKRLYPLLSTQSTC